MTLVAGLWEAVQGEAWDDIRTPATAIPIRGQSGDPDSDVDGTLLFDKDSVEQVALLYQMPHAWKQGSTVRFHCHWSKTSNASGTVLWQERHRIWDNGSVAPAWSSWTGPTGISLATGADQKTRITSFAEWSMTGMKGSCMVSVQLRRNASATGAATGVTDSYAADVRLWDVDLHARMFGLGSEQEYPS